MINSFWNICSTCPMPREEKLNSEYKRNYVWHPLYRPLAHEVISSAPRPFDNDIGIQRRKQYPELAYKNHEVIRHDLIPDVTDSRARSEEREFGICNKSGPRSRSAEPGMGRQLQKQIMVQSFPPISAGRVCAFPKTDEMPEILEQSSETTEYKSQYAWPKKAKDSPPCFARKSMSMNVIKSYENIDSCITKSKLAPVHRPCVKQKDYVIEKSLQDFKKKAKTEYKAKYKPFTSYVYVDGQWKKTSRLMKVPESKEEPSEEPWFVEVAERLQKANEYRWRGHGQPVYGELLPDIYSKSSHDVPAQRPTKLPLELPLNHPQCHKSVKKEENKKRETHSELSEKKREVKKQVSKRPKSAEPFKSKEPIKYKRPATTPPVKPTNTLPIKKRTPKMEDVKKIPKTKCLKKGKENTATKKTSPSSAGKAWLQAGQYVPITTGKKPVSQECPDAVGPSSLPPITSKEVSPNVAAQKVISSEQQSSVVPLTHVLTPEEVTGVKSPEPENWTIPLENKEHLQWSRVNTSDPPEKVKSPETISASLSKLSVTDEPKPSVCTTQDSNSDTGKVTSTNVLDRARSRLDQFWGKNK